MEYQAERSEVKSKPGIYQQGERVRIEWPLRSKTISKLEEIIIPVKGSPTPSRILPRGLSRIEENIHPEDKRILQEWHKIFALSCLFALLVDPMFGYTLVLDDEKGCLHLDKRLAIIVIIFRSLTDLVYVVHIIMKFRFSFVVGYQATKKGKLEKKHWDRAKIIMFFYHLVDILAIAPVPQVILFGRVQRTKSSKLLELIQSMKYVIIAQYVPRSVRLFPLHREVMGWNDTRRRMITVWVKSAFNLALYILASHVFGACWYLSAVQRKAKCWQQAFKEKGGSEVPCLDCEISDVQKLILERFCPVNPPNATQYDFGMYIEALQSGIGTSTNIFRKFSYSFLWGLQNLSSLGQGLKTSTSLEEIGFAVIISISGLVLFAFLIGNMQAYLQSGTQRSEQMRLKMEEIELWMSFHSFPRNLKKKIWQLQEYVWRKTRGLDVESLLISLPRELRRDIKCHLCQGSLRKVPVLQNMNEQVLNQIYDCLKPMLYLEKSCVIRKGDDLDEMIIITVGKLYACESANTNTTILNYGDVYGQELFEWAFRSSSSSMSNLPLSTKTLRTTTKVEAFVLTANDLLHVVSKHRSFFTTHLVDSPNSIVNLKDGAAFIIQSAWRHHMKTKLDNGQSTSKIQNRMAHEAVVNLPTTTKMIPKFATVARNALQRKRSTLTDLERKNAIGTTSDASRC